MKKHISLTNLICHGSTPSTQLGTEQREFFSIHELKQLNIEVECNNDSNIEKTERIVLYCEVSKGMEPVFKTQIAEVEIENGESKKVDFHFNLSDFFEQEDVDELCVTCYEASLKEKTEVTWYDKSCLCIEHPAAIMLLFDVADVPEDPKACFELNDFMIVKQDELEKRNQQQPMQSYVQLKPSNIKRLNFIWFFKTKIDRKKSHSLKFQFYLFDANETLLCSETCSSFPFNDDEDLFYASLLTNELEGMPEGVYTIYIEYLSHIILKVPFSIGNVNLTGQHDLDKIAIDTTPKENKAQITIQQAEENFKAMIGLVDLKKQVKQHLDFIRLQKMRKQMGLTAQIPPLHMIFTGNPGTGKTTVANYLGSIYHGMGLIEKGHVVFTERSKLVGRYLGETEKNTELAITEAKGGILFIDEAYNLWVRGIDDTKNDYGNRVLETLLTKLADPNFDVVVILAGYPIEMEKMLSSNPGLKSRFAYYLNFPDYNVEELKAIADLHLKQLEYKLDQKADQELIRYFKAAYKQRTASFGNARFVVHFITNVMIPNMATRLVTQQELMEGDHDKELLTTITADDIPPYCPCQKKHYKIDEEVIENVLYQLETLIGLTEVKENIRHIIDLAHIRIENGKSPLANPFAKWSFVGNTGTGKSTVAQLLTDLLYAFQIIPDANCVEISGEQIFFTPDHMLDNLFAHLVKNNNANVLFIDCDAETFKKRYKTIDFELIHTKLENLKLETKHDYILIVAENKANNDCPLYIHQKASDEINHVLYFNDYTTEELYTTCLKMLSERGFNLKKEAHVLLKHTIDVLKKNKSDDANLRTMHYLADALTHKAYLRMSKSHQIEQALLLSSEDIKALKLEHLLEVKQKQRIGFIN